MFHYIIINIIFFLQFFFLPLHCDFVQDVKENFGATAEFDRKKKQKKTGEKLTNRKYQN